MNRLVSVSRWPEDWLPLEAAAVVVKLALLRYGPVMVAILLVVEGSGVLGPQGVKG